MSVFREDSARVCPVALCSTQGLQPQLSHSPPGGTSSRQKLVPYETEQQHPYPNFREPHGLVSQPDLADAPRFLHFAATYTAPAKTSFSRHPAGSDKTQTPAASSGSAQNPADIPDQIRGTFHRSHYPH